MLKDTISGEGSGCAECKDARNLTTHSTRPSPAGLSSSRWVVSGMLSPMRWLRSAEFGRYVAISGVGGYSYGRIH
jgi:hypothetical protein